MKLTITQRLILGLGIIIGIVVLTQIAKFFEPPQISSFTPTNNTIDVLPSDPITISFNKPAQGKVVFDIVPSQQIIEQWSQDKKSVSLFSQPEWKRETNYTLSVISRKKMIAQTQFTTSLYTQAELNQILQEQTQQDVLFNQGMIKTHQEKPWLAILPIETILYRAVFDYDENKIRIRLLTNESTEIAALQDLANKKIDAKKIGYYIINP